MTHKKQKLVIPNKYLPWVKPELAERNGEITTYWDKRLDRCGWLEDIEEPELMTLQEAIGNKKENDLLRENGHGPLVYIDDNGELRYKIDHNHVRSHVDHFNKKKWQIIPAEPVVLSAEEYLNKEYGKISEVYRADNEMIKIFEAGDLNGQRRRDGDYKELLEGVYRFIETGMPDGITLAIENLKTLKTK